jgi:hypothetical protein
VFLLLAPLEILLSGKKFHSIGLGLKGKSALRSVEMGALYVVIYLALLFIATYVLGIQTSHFDEARRDSWKYRSDNSVRSVLGHSRRGLDILSTLHCEQLARSKKSGDLGLSFLEETCNFFFPLSLELCIASFSLWIISPRL